ncbi:MAG: hypothetical protein MJZ16_09100 [Bacteroidales bacterium]|nr:hypothetical protein [Bacteroidales bacterium]
MRINEVRYCRISHYLYVEDSTLLLMELTHHDRERFTQLLENAIFTQC